ncbi:hypothetical protein N0V94_006696 [Neodidymelliopsis sp. IMI 364377]|nr:hypothetical protein N0V94_006696 [Neodidymelliopsis sp. IMI 364377]
MSDINPGDASRTRRIVTESPLSIGQLLNNSNSSEESLSPQERLLEQLLNLQDDIASLRQLSQDQQFRGSTVDAVASLLAITTFINCTNIVNQLGGEGHQHHNAQTPANNSATETTRDMPLASTASTKPNMPVVNLVPVLPKIDYKEQDEKEFERSLKYVQVQCKILQYLEKHDTSLTSKDAYKFTRAIVPKGQRPAPQQAVRLCYYMRSLRFDTFAVIKDVSVFLFVADPKSDTRGPAADHLYWAQNLSTHEFISKAYNLICGDSQSSLRRNGRVDARGSVPASAANNYVGTPYGGIAQLRGGSSEGSSSDDSNEETNSQTPLSW